MKLVVVLFAFARIYRAFFKAKISELSRDKDPIRKHGSHFHFFFTSIQKDDGQSEHVYQRQLSIFQSYKGLRGRNGQEEAILSFLHVRSLLHGDNSNETFYVYRFSVNSDLTSNTA